MKINTEPIKELLKKYRGNLLLASSKELVRVFKRANGDMEMIIDKAQDEFEKEEQLAEEKMSEGKQLSAGKVSVGK